MDENEPSLRWHEDPSDADETSNSDESQGEPQELDTEHCAEIIDVLVGIVEEQRINLRDPAREKTDELKMDDYTDRQVIAFINNSCRSDWTVKPVFFAALVRQAIKRGLYEYPLDDEEGGTKKPPLKLI